MIAKSQYLCFLCHIKPTFARNSRASLQTTARYLSTVKNQDEDTLACSSPLQGHSANSSSLTLQWQTGKARYHNVWLRHNCLCEQCTCPNSKQKFIDMALIPSDIQPADVKTTGDKIRIAWNDGHESEFESEWLKENAYDEAYVQKDKPDEFKILDGEGMELWDRDTITCEPPKEFSFDELQRRDADTEFSLLDTIMRHGFTFVNDTPLDPESLAKLCECIGSVQETLFGRVYSLKNKTFLNVDGSFRENALAAHTDHVYYNFPAAIQAMHCTYHHGTGGQSLLVDGFHAAKMLHHEDRDAFKILTRTQVPFALYSESYLTRVHGPIIQLSPITGEVALLRYNNSRAGIVDKLKLDFAEIGEFYHAVRAFGGILRRPENELWFKLTPGRVIVMDNRRVMHGRSAVSGSRQLRGCYVGLDDFIGRWRAMKYSRDNNSC